MFYSHIRNFLQTINSILLCSRPGTLMVDLALAGGVAALLLAVCSFGYSAFDLHLFIYFFYGQHYTRTDICRESVGQIRLLSSVCGEQYTHRIRNQRRNTTRRILLKKKNKSRTKNDKKYNKCGNNKPAACLAGPEK